MKEGNGKKRFSVWGALREGSSRANSVTVWGREFDLDKAVIWPYFIVVCVVLVCDFAAVSMSMLKLW